MTKPDEQFAILTAKDGRAVALKGVAVNARISGLLATVEVEQSYLNPEAKNIEAVYTFPLPIGAVLLGLEVEIDGKTLVGTAVERKKAERDYEDAITDGNSAVMLEEAGPGLYTASLGNLMANESAVIRYRYALPLSWQGTRLRLLLPTTIAPRYGNAKAAGLRVHQVPTSSLEVEYPLSLAVTVERELASSRIACLSHPVSIRCTENGVIINLSPTAVLDRDFVLTIESPHSQSSCVAVPDADGTVVMASLRIPPQLETESQPISLKVVIDCSGSMGGTSIQQARKAALEILNQLRPTDKFNFTLFGSKFEHIFKGMVHASQMNIAAAWKRLDELDADMGGTEMETALESVFSLGDVEGQAALVLITDGEIHEHEKLVQRASRSGHRIFVVGVGNSVAEVFLRSLANTTGGACELVAPQEGMAEKVLSQFHRVRQPKLEYLAIEWPTPPTWETALPETVFAGDTVHVFAGFSTAVSGSVRISAQGSEGATSSLIQDSGTDIPRVAAAYRIKAVSDELGASLSLKYQLLSKWTNYLVIAERETKAGDLPALHHLPQMLAAGWGGTSSAISRKAPGDRGIRLAMASPARLTPAQATQLANNTKNASRASYGYADMPNEESLFGSDPVPAVSKAHASRAGASPPPKQVRGITPKQFIERLEATVFLYSAEPKLPESLAELEALGLDEMVADAIRKLLAGGHMEIGIVIALLHAMAESAISDLFERNLKRLILKRWKDIKPVELFNQEMTKAVKGIATDDWRVKDSEDYDFNF